MIVGGVGVFGAGVGEPGPAVLNLLSKGGLARGSQGDQALLPWYLGASFAGPVLFENLTQDARMLPFLLAKQRSRRNDASLNRTQIAGRQPGCSFLGACWAVVEVGGGDSY